MESLKRGRSEMEETDEQRQQRIRLLLAALGDGPASVDLEDTLKSTAMEMMKEVHSGGKDYVLSLLFDCVLCLSHKIPLYATVIALSIGRDESSEFGRVIVETLQRELVFSMLPRCVAGSDLTAESSVRSALVVPFIENRTTLKSEESVPSWIETRSEGALNVNAEALLSLQSVVGLARVSGYTRHKNNQDHPLPPPIRLSTHWPAQSGVVSVDFDRVRCLLMFAASLAECGVLKLSDWFDTLVSLSEQTVFNSDVSYRIREQFAFCLGLCASMNSASLTADDSCSDGWLAWMAQFIRFVEMEVSKHSDWAAERMIFAFDKSARDSCTPLQTLCEEMKRITGQVAAVSAVESDKPATERDFVMDEEEKVDEPSHQRSWHIESMCAPWVWFSLQKGPGLPWSLPIHFDWSGLKIRNPPIWLTHCIPKLIPDKITKGVRSERTPIGLLFAGVFVTDLIRGFADSPVLCAELLNASVAALMDESYRRSPSEHKSSAFGSSFLIMEAVFAGLLTPKGNSQPSLDVWFEGSEACRIGEMPVIQKPWIIYARVLIELFRISAKTWPRLVGPLMNNAFLSGLPQLDLEVRTHLIQWFSLHLSNFGFHWPWLSWAKILGDGTGATDSDESMDPPSCLDDWKSHLSEPLLRWHQELFLVDLLAECVSLSYQRKVTGSIPSVMYSLLPSSELAKDSSEAWSSSVCKLMKDRCSADQIISAIQECDYSESDFVKAVKTKLTTMLSELDDCEHYVSALTDLCCMVYCLVHSGQGSLSRLSSLVLLYASAIKDFSLEVPNVTIEEDSPSVLSDGCFRSVKSILQWHSEDSSWKLSSSMLKEMGIMLALQQCKLKKHLLTGFVDKLHAAQLLSGVGITKWVLFNYADSMSACVECSLWDALCNGLTRELAIRDASQQRFLAETVKCIRDSNVDAPDPDNMRVLQSRVSSLLSIMLNEFRALAKHMDEEWDGSSLTHPIREDTNPEELPRMKAGPRMTKCMAIDRVIGNFTRICRLLADEWPSLAKSVASDTEASGIAQKALLAQMQCSLKMYLE